MSEEKEPKAFIMQGNIKYEIELRESDFAYRGQISSENNLANLLAIRELSKGIIDRQANPALPAKEKLSKKEVELIKATHRWTAIASERVASILFSKAVEKNLTPDAPKIEIAPAMANLKKV